MLVSLRQRQASATIESLNRRDTIAPRYDRSARTREQLGVSTVFFNRPLRPLNQQSNR
jgi:hypothetical protein